ncbi:hypothetical protein APHAL10511_006187 [Amanita phalloides]|nr:hypothetical protein APHAL10511_006187 [Amanita phalloides]
MWCTRWFLPLLLLPLPTAPPLFLLLFLCSLTLHARPCFYCILLLSSLFLSSCYWQPFPIHSPLAVPWSPAITSFADALNVTLPVNFSYPLPPVIRAVDRCWCDFSSGFFQPFNVSHWELLTVNRLALELEQPLRQNISAPQNISAAPLNWTFLKDWMRRSRRVEEKSEPDETETPDAIDMPRDRRWDYDLRQHGFDLIVDFKPSPSASTKLEYVQRAIMAPFGHRSTHSTRILSDLAPIIMTPRMMNSASAISSRQRVRVRDTSTRLDFTSIVRAPLRLTLAPHTVTSRDLQIVEATDELLEAEIPDPQGIASNVSLLRGFNATIPSADQNRARRRHMRSVDTPKLGLKRLGMTARGMITEDDVQSVASEDDLVLVSASQSAKKGKRRGKGSLGTTKTLGKGELDRQAVEIRCDKENIHVRRSLINSEIDEITHKIEALDEIRAKLEQDLLRLQEDELELDAELEGVKERLAFEQSSVPPSSSRRRKGPAFLPSEHDELPPGVAFMTLESHLTPVTALDLSEPYGTLVSAAQEDAQPRVWDLLSGSEIGRLEGHSGTVKCLQVESHICLTGAEDGTVRLWDLRKVGDDDDLVRLNEVGEEDSSEPNKNDSCIRLLEGHTQAVTALYFEDDCLVTGASDKTLRQWDLNTGQCVMTMDILWAISHPHAANIGSSTINPLFPGAVASGAHFAVPMPAYADGSWDMYEDFVGGVQFWGYGLVSGSGDGAVRMWDMRTGQAHRTLLGHTGPITCLQFDEIHIMSGSLDKTVRIWDLRTGGTFQTIKYDHAVTALQFDTRKIVAAAGDNGIKVYNRTSMQQATLWTNGHTKPVERLRYMDRYLVSGGRDSTVKIWSL